MTPRLNCLVLRFAVWLLALALFPLPVTVLARSFQVEVLECITPLALPQERPLNLNADLTARVAARLVDAEFREPDAWYRDDYRIARVTLGFARKCSPFPHVEASYAVLGVHPDQVWPRIMARRQSLLLASSCKDFFGGLSSPRKPARSVKLQEFERRNNAA